MTLFNFGKVGFPEVKDTPTKEEPKILIWDLETTPNLVYSFQMWNTNINYASIVKNSSIICGAAKWLGEEEIFMFSILDNMRAFKKDPYNDLSPVTGLYKLLQQADIIVAHHGDGFDIKVFNTRALANGLDPLPHITSVDTLKVAKKYFKFNFNKLDYISQFIGGEAKIKTDMQLWIDVCSGKEEAVREMMRYNIQDVHVLEKVYLALRPSMNNHPNSNVFVVSEEHKCPACSSTNLRREGYVSTRMGKYQRYKCNDCKTWSQGRSNVIKGGVEIR